MSAADDERGVSPMTSQGLDASTNARSAAPRARRLAERALAEWGYVLAVAIALALAARSPAYNWDLIPYTGVVLEIETRDVERLHARTYADVERAVPPDVFATLTRGSYRGRVFEDPRVFHEQLGLNRVRPLYIALLYVLHKCSVPIVTAMALVSLASAVWMAVAIRRLLRHAFSPPAGALVAFLVVVASGCLDVARLYTPDALAHALVLVAVDRIVARRLRIATLFLALSLLARPDNIVTVIGIVLYATLLAPGEYRLPRRIGVAAILGAAAVALLVHRLGGGFGWNALFYASFVERILRPSLFQPTIEPAQYFGVLGAAIRNSVLSGDRFFLVSVIGVVGFLSRSPADPPSILRRDLILLMLGCVAARFLLYPTPDGRFFVGPYAIVCVAALARIAARAGDQPRPSGDHVDPMDAGTR